MKPFSIFSLLIIMIAACSGPPKPETISGYPASAKVDTVDE
jgi:hypothetical protein